MLPLLRFHTSGCGQVHSASYPNTAIERIVEEGAGIEFHGGLTLLGLETGAVILRDAVDATQYPEAAEAPPGLSPY